MYDAQIREGLFALSADVRSSAGIEIRSRSLAQKNSKTYDRSDVRSYEVFNYFIARGYNHEQIPVKTGRRTCV
jgi:hypothetical protein